MVWILTPQRASGTLVESWEDTDHSEWRHLDPTTDDTAYVSDVVWEGSQALEKSGYDEAISHPGDGLPEYFKKGEIWAFYLYIRSGLNSGVTGVYFAAQDRDNCFVTQWDGANDGQLETFLRQNDASQYFLGNGESCPQDTWLEVRITRDDGTLGGKDNEIRVTWTRMDTGATIAEHSAVDSTFASESAIGFHNSSGIVTVFDAFTQDPDGATTDTKASGTVIEDFNNSDLSRYEGTTGTYQIVSTPAYEGTAAGQGDGSFDRIYDTGVTTPPKGSTFEAYVRASTTAATQDVGIYYGVQDADNPYFVEMQADEAEFVAKTKVAGSFSTMASATGLTLAADTWYRIRVRWDDGTAYGGTDGDMTLTIREAGTAEDLATLTVTANTDHPAGGFGFKYNTASGSPVFHDLYQIVDQP